MHQKISDLLKNYQSLNQKLNEASTRGDSSSIQSIGKELGEISEFIDKANTIKKLSKEIEDAHSLLETETDKDTIDYYNELINTDEPILEELENTLLKDLEQQDPNDKRDCIIEIRAGTGGEEAALFASELYRMYLRFAEKQGWKTEQLSMSEAGQGGIKEVIASIKGTGVYGKLRFENGVHRVQRVPSTESSGRIHTSSASVVVLPEVEDHEVEVNPDDIKIDVYRAGGPGGQGVNTTDSAVRLTHIPTGLVVSCQDERSQLKNKHRALSILKSRLFELEQLKEQEALSSQRKTAIKTGDRSEKIKTYNFPQSRMTDHRIKESWFNLSEILEGELEEIIETTRIKLLSDNETE